MDRVAEIRKYMEWTEEQVLAGNASPTVEQYEEALRVERYRDALTHIIDFTRDDYRDDPQGGYGQVHVIARSAIGGAA